MFLELIATFIAGLAAAGIVLLTNRVLGNRFPRWLTPVAAGAVMIATTIYSEYDWFSRTKATLAEGVVVAQTVESKAVYRPWTYMWPYVERFAAVDTASIRTHPQHPGVKLAEVYFFGRWAPINEMMVITDCPGQKRAALADAISFDEDGTVDGADWIKVPGEDAILTTVCGTV